MTVAVLVPRRADGDRRDDLWNYCRARWARDLPDWPVIEGEHPGEDMFNRSLAINRAAELADPDVDVFVIADSDTIVGARQLREAVEGARHPRMPRFWLAYDLFHYLGRAMSDEIMDGFEGSWMPGVEWSMAGTCSSMVVVARSLFEEVGGFDEGFVGWGFEDVAFSHACQTFGGGVRRAKGDAWHLHHAMSAENNAASPEWTANRTRMLRYAAASYRPDAMRELLDTIAGERVA